LEGTSVLTVAAVGVLAGGCWSAGVAVGGTDVAVGGTAVGGAAVGAGGTAVAVGGREVAVGGGDVTTVATGASGDGAAVTEKFAAASFHA
jgi:hypothetical protein